MKYHEIYIYIYHVCTCLDKKSQYYYVSVLRPGRYRSLYVYRQRKTPDTIAVGGGSSGVHGARVEISDITRGHGRITRVQPINDIYPLGSLVPNGLILLGSLNIHRVTNHVFFMYLAGILGSLDTHTHVLIMGSSCTSRARPYYTCTTHK